MVNGGEVLTPSQVKGFGMDCPDFQALVVRVNAVERIWGLVVLSVAALVLAGRVEPAFFRAGAVAPGFGSSARGEGNGNCCNGKNGETSAAGFRQAVGGWGLAHRVETTRVELRRGGAPPADR